MKTQRLTEAQVAEINDLFSGDFSSIRELAMLFKVTNNTIRYQVNYKNFKNKIKEISIQRYRSNPEKAKEITKQWRLNNLEKFREYQNNYYKKRRLCQKKED